MESKIETSTIPQFAYAACQQFPTDAPCGFRHSVRMTTARSLLVDPEAPGFYRISRCVRRAWMCGVDLYNGKSYEHRRKWVEFRLLELAEVFAFGIYAYAVIRNHFHVVVRIDPEAVATWTAEEVATRWVRLFLATSNGEVDALACRTKEQNLLGNAERLEICARAGKSGGR